MAEFRTTTCRSCDARVIWATTSNGKAMPVDELPVDDGNVELALDVHGRAVATVLTGPSLLGGPLRTSHFVSCPQADQWRQG